MRMCGRGSNYTKSERLVDEVCAIISAISGRQGMGPS